MKMIYKIGFGEKLRFEASKVLFEASKAYFDQTSVHTKRQRRFTDQNGFSSTITPFNRVALEDELTASLEEKGAQ